MRNGSKNGGGGGAKVPRRKSRSAKRLAKPHWDGWFLWWRGEPVRQFRKRAPAQMAVLAEFERLGWPERIDVGRLLANGGSRYRWALYTAKNLNHGLIGIKFHADGTKRGMCWFARRI